MTFGTRFSLVAALVCTASVPAVAGPTGRVTARAGLERADGGPVRAHRLATPGPAPRAARRAWTAFTAAAGPRWMATWDRATGVPSRLFGGVIAAPGTVASAEAAEAFARAILSRHVDLLAPGASAADFVLAANDLDRGMRTVGFFQHHRGLRVLGGQVSFRFKNDRLFVIASEALPAVTASAPQAALDPARARASAAAWAGAGAGAVEVGAIDGPFVLPLVGDGGVLGYRTVVRVVVATQKPINQWSVYVDAAGGEPVARESRLRFGEGTLLFNVPERYPGAGRSELPAPHAGVTIDGVPGVSSDAGVLSWAGDAAAQLVTTVAGPLVRTRNDAGPAASVELTLQPGGSVLWDEAEDELRDAQLITFIHSHVAKAWAKHVAPEMTWLDERMDATVNIDDNCNAFSDGDSINFFQAGSGCANTGRLADVVYHEFGHSFHAHAIIPGVGDWGDGSLGEGVGDYFAVTITNDAGMGRGFFNSTAPLRQIDPPNREYVWPDDVGQIHDTGRIYAGAMWDLRGLLIAAHGEAEGVALADQLYYQTIRRAVDIPSTYVEILAADDDDGDLGNGTPNACAINDAFGRHGLRTISSQVKPLAAELPELDGFHVELELTGLFAQCPGDQLSGATLHWELRDLPAQAGTVDMTSDDDGTWTGAIPLQPEGQVVRYRVEVALGDGNLRSYPDNAADPMYEFFVGPVETLYCTDFETDPAEDGWSHGLASGQASEGADDWMWGTPAGVAGSGDPQAAFSGTGVFGNDLGGGRFNGLYQAEKVNFALSPVVDVGNYSSIRLQYWRWLNVEDAFYDQASIYVNDELAWRNLDSQEGEASSTHHQDREWRFHDVDISDHVVDGTVQVKYEIASDGGLELGGWTLDDFCIVAYAASVCGDGEVTGVEQCDDGAGNSDGDADACRTSCRAAACGDGVVDSDEACDDGNLADGDACSPSCTLPPGVDGEGEGGCGCRTGGRDGGRGGAAGLLLLLGAALIVRRRRRPR